MKNKATIEVFEHDKTSKRDFIIRFKRNRDAIVLTQEEFLAVRDAFRDWINTEAYK